MDGVPGKSAARRAAEFEPTRWSIVLAAAEKRSGTRQRRALEELVAGYWYPLYCYVRRRGHGPDEAEDLTQEFFARLLEKKILCAVDRQKGAFRSFLLACVKNFLSTQWHRSQALKRGGGKSIISWGGMEAEARYMLEPADNLTPERHFDRRWALAVLDSVLERLRKDYAEAGQAELFEAIRGRLTSGPEDSATQATIAGRLGMTTGALKMALSRLRKRYRGLLREEIAQTVASPEQVDDEIRILLNSL